MDVGLHVKQGLNHLNRVINYAPFVAQQRNATVHLTWEDWHVLADMLFHMDTPRDLLPASVTDVQLSDDQQAILVATDAYDIRVETM